MQIIIAEVSDRDYQFLREYQSVGLSKQLGRPLITVQRLLGHVTPFVETDEQSLGQLDEPELCYEGYHDGRSNIEPRHRDDDGYMQGYRSGQSVLHQVRSTN
jgi:hypothetical protein